MWRLISHNHRRHQISKAASKQRPMAYGIRQTYSFAWNKFVDVAQGEMQNSQRNALSLFK